MATIGDVAKRAGVSRTAVSFAFNKPEQLAATTLRRILDVAHDLGYYPNPAARSLNTGRTGIVGVLIPQRAAIVCANPFILEFLRGIAQVCDRHGLTILLVSPVRGSLTRAMNNVAVDGFIALGIGERHSEVDLLRRRGVPFVVVDAHAPDGVPSVQVDDEGGARQAAECLLEAGHRDVLVLAVHSPQGDIDPTPQAESDGDDAQVQARDDVLQRRLRGYALAFAAYDLAPPALPDRLIFVESTIDEGERALRAALRTSPRPTAVLAMSDALAIGVLRHARNAGLHVPRDLSVVGFDDIVFASFTDPPLTTVRQSAVEKGLRAADLLVESLATAAAAAAAASAGTDADGIEAISPVSLAPVRHVLPTALVRRGTVAPPAAAVH